MVRRADRPLLLLACALLLLAGCAIHGLGPRGDEPTVVAAAALGEVRHRDEVRIALFVAMALALAFVVIVDLCILPFSRGRRHLHFPCCRAVIHFCIH